MTDLNVFGITLGVASFAIIGLFHPLVIKGEYYFGTKVWMMFFAAGITSVILSLIVNSVFISTLLGIFGFASFWGIKEVFDQEKRVKAGRFPKNPKRK